MSLPGVLPATAGAKGFQLKQFTLEHDRCAMKVSTDSLVLGSWAKCDQAKRILDIGTGCGLLALMAIQKSPPDAHADAIEIDTAAARQAAQNVASSPWPTRVRVQRSAIQEFAPELPYDFIICNPPYFSRPKPSAKAYQDQSLPRQTARQQNSLPPLTLFGWVAAYLSPEGKFSCIYPWERVAEICSVAAKSGLHLLRRLDVKSTATGPPHVSALEFAPGVKKISESGELIVRDEQNAYTTDFRLLCKDFYLHF